MGRTRRIRAAAGRRRGSTLVELMSAMAVLAIGLNTMIGSLAESVREQAATRERAAAMDALESTLEQLQAVPFEELYARFNAIESDDVTAGLIGSPGAAFDVTGLTPQTDDPDGRVGRVEFPGDGTALRESVVDAELGMPRDLNGDGAVDELDHAADYRVLPVRVVVEWQGAAGRSRLVVFTTIAGR